MLEDTGVGSLDVGLEAAVEHADLAPVTVEGLDVVVANTGTKLGLFKSSADSTHGRLRGQARHAYTKVSAIAKHKRENVLSMATSITSAPAAAAANIEAVAIPAVS